MENDENDELKGPLMEALEDDDADICERCGGGIMVQRFGLQLCSAGCSPFEGAPMDTRLLLRVSAADHKCWHYSAEVGRHSVSAMIRGEVNGYVASPVPGVETWERPIGEQVAFYEVAKRGGFDLPNPREKKARRDQTIELRVSAAERELWARAAQEDGRSLTGMIRRAVMRHVWRMMDVLGYR